MRFKPLYTAVAAGLIAIGAAGCEVDQTEEGEMPQVDVEGGNMPEYDVRGPDVDVGTRTETVEVPTVDVEPPADTDAPPE